MWDGFGGDDEGVCVVRLKVCVWEQFVAVCVSVYEWKSEKESESVRDRGRTCDVCRRVWFVCACVFSHDPKRVFYLRGS